MRTTYRHNRRGVALLEFVFCLPFFLLIIAGTFMFGTMMRNEQRLRVTDRYVSWRVSHNSDAGVDASNLGAVKWGEPNEGTERQNFIDEYLRVNKVTLTGKLLNESFYEKRANEPAVKWTHSSRTGPREPYEELIAGAQEASEDTGRLAEEAMGGWSYVSDARVSATFPRENSLAETVEQHITRDPNAETGMTDHARRRHIRSSVQWRRGQNSYLEPIRKHFLAELDDVIQAMQNDQLRKNLSDLYMNRW
ncbi:MAG: hypothetical protein HN909_08005 [Phycisphaerales bacterium]|jgi:hypothetical protein|nr:hypothetical protein [Phycisphaerales bacterium]MBT7171699.1 hypothetical protein [Phycisphaerales bacterium]